MSTIEHPGEDAAADETLKALAAELVATHGRRALTLTHHIRQVLAEEIATTIAQSLPWLERIGVTEQSEIGDDGRSFNSPTYHLRIAGFDVDVDSAGEFALYDDLDDCEIQRLAAALSIDGFNIDEMAPLEERLAPAARAAIELYELDQEFEVDGEEDLLLYVRDDDSLARLADAQ